MSEFHKWVKEVVRNACEEALIVEEFVPDPIFNEREGTKYTCMASVIILGFVTYIHVHV